MGLRCDGFCDGSGDNEKLSHYFEANCDGCDRSDGFSDEKEGLARLFFKRYGLSLKDALSQEKLSPPSPNFEANGEGFHSGEGFFKEKEENHE